MTVPYVSRDTVGDGKRFGTERASVAFLVMQYFDVVANVGW